MENDDDYIDYSSDDYSDYYKNKFRPKNAKKEGWEDGVYFIIGRDGYHCLFLKEGRDDDRYKELTKNDTEPE